MTETKLSQNADVFEGLLFLLIYVIIFVLFPASLIIGLALIIGVI